MIALVKGGTAPAAILSAIAESEGRQQELKEELAALEEKVASVDRERLRKRLRAMAKGRQGATHHSHMSVTRLASTASWVEMKLTVAPLTDGRKGVLVFGDLIGGELGTCLTARNGSGSSTSRG